jgi:signal transduction histidine kinase
MAGTLSGAIGLPPAAAVAALNALAGPAAGGQVAIFDTQRDMKLGTSGATLQLPEQGLLSPIAADRSAFVVGPLVRDGDQPEIFYTMAVGIFEEGRLVGYLAERRVVGTGQNATVDLISALIGEEAKLTFGNVAGDVWTPFPVPPVTGSPVLRPAVTVVDGRPMAARVAPIAGTPWVTGVALPLAPVLAPLREFLGGAITITAVIVCLAALAGWIGSRRITMPLNSLTDAAEALATGDSAPRLDLSRSDELGRLASSFNTMTERVTESRHALQRSVDELEHRVAARTAALESANKELEAFSYSVSHDLRAPLRAVTGFAKILVEDHAAKLEPSARECVDVIAERARHMGQLIDDLLAFSRLGRTAIAHQTVDMDRLVRRVIDDVVRADSSRVVNWDVQAALPPATGEPALLQQVFANLIQNAVKFTRTRPDAVITVGFTSTPRGAAYFVRDTGVGFDMKYADRLFGVFQRLHAQQDFEGTGVGLAIVHRIVARHGGEVWADATPGQGATFYFTLPTAPGEIA